MSALTVSKEDEKRVKGMGFLNNRGTDLFSARVLTINGKVTAAQHRCMAEAAEKFGNGNLLYTTRLSVEIQGIPYNKIEEFQQFIAKEEEPEQKSVRWYPARERLASMDFWIPMRSPRKSTNVFMKDTVMSHCRINSRSQ